MADIGHISTLAFSLPLLSLTPLRISSSRPHAHAHAGSGTATGNERRRAPTAHAAPSANTPIVTTRLQKTRLRLHLLQLERQQRRNAASTPPFTETTEEPRPLFPSYMQNPFATATSPDAPSDDELLTNKRRKSHPPSSHTYEVPKKANSASSASTSSTSPSSYSSEERRARSERLRARWRDPEWRAAMLAKRGTTEASRRRSEALKLQWQDESWRKKMRQARLGRPAPNKGVPASRVTRLRMSVARKGSVKSPEARRRMSVAKRGRPKDDEWRRLISESKKGKTREYFAMRREFRALYRDLKLWSDSFRAKHGRLPSASSYERFVAPIMVLRIRRYLTLRDAIGDEEIESNTDIMSKD